MNESVPCTELPKNLKWVLTEKKKLAEPISQMSSYEEPQYVRV